MSRDVSNLKAGSEARKGAPSQGMENRRRALEDAFFQQKDEELLSALRERMLHDVEADLIAQEIGADSRRLADALVDLGIRSETLPALALTPAIAIAWADGKVSAWESWEIHEQATNLGLKPDSASYDLLTAWLKEAPGPELFDAWVEYAKDVVGRLPAWERNRFAERILEAARKVAEASRAGALEPLVSKEERELLDRIEAAIS